MRKVVAAAVLAMAIGMSGCTAPLPHYETVRDETRSAMQEIVDLMPADVKVEDASTETPYRCNDASAMYTGLWRVYGQPDFDPARFVESLEANLSSEWRIDEDAIATPRTDAALITRGMIVEVAVLQDGDGGGILAISRCGALPREG